MIKPDRCNYTTLDFLDWKARGSIALQPKFQRREVWTTQKKSYLIDSLLKQMPVPPILLRVAQAPNKDKIVREIIDGQQRVRAVLDFVEGKYALSPTQASEHGAARFEKLKQEKKDLIKQFSFVCEVFHGITDGEVLEIFARVNTYSVQLNRQELINGKYFGLFKQCVYKLAYEHLEFWRQRHIYSETAIARMSEVELTSELVIVLLDGMQHKKDTIESFYAKYDSVFPTNAKTAKSFRKVIDSIQEILNDDLEDTEFHRPPFFYTLFAVVAHRVVGIPKVTVARKTTSLTADEIQSARDALLKVSELISDAKEAKAKGEVSSQFIDACLKSTDKLQQREIRFNTIYKRAFAR